MKEQKNKLKLNIFLPSDIIDELKKKYNPSTVTTIQRNLKSIFLNVFDEDKFDINKMVKQPKKIIEYLEKQNNSRQTTLLFALKTLSSVIPNYKLYKPYENITKETWELKKKLDVFKIPTVKELEKESSFKWSDVKEISDLLLKNWLNDKESYRKYQKMLMSQFLNSIPPLRAQDYSNIKILDDEPKDEINHINLSTGELVLYTYKTKEYYGKREIELPEDLVMLIAEGKEIFDLKWLFPKITNDKESLTSGGITELIQRTFRNPNIGTQFLRKLYVSKLIDDGASAKERLKVAEIMAHSIITQSNIYTSLSKNLHRTEKNE